MSQSFWPQLISLHAWATAISLVVICLSTISLIRHRSTLGHWAVWLGVCTVPALLGVSMHFMHATATANSYLADTVYLTAYHHAYGTAVLLVALGGLTALKKMKSGNFSLKISFVFALLITISGVVLTLQQAGLGLNGMPRRYIDYPHEFAQLQFYSSIAAIACFSLAAIYVIILWRHSDKKSGKVEEVF